MRSSEQASQSVDDIRRLEETLAEFASQHRALMSDN